MISKTEVRVHRNLEATVDAILQGRSPNFEVRRVNQQSSYEFEPVPPVHNSSQTSKESEFEDTWGMEENTSNHDKPVAAEHSCKDETTLCIFLYGISESSIIQGMKQLKMDDTVEFTGNISEADVLMALQSKLKKNSQLQAAARSRGIPTYISKTNSLAQITKAIQALMSDYADGFESYKSKVETNEMEKIDALEEARIAIEQILIPKRVPVDLLPRASNVLLLQKDLVRKYNFKSERIVSELGLLHLRILPLPSTPIDEDSSAAENAGDTRNFGNFYKLTDENDGPPFSVSRLPFLPTD